MKTAFKWLISARNGEVSAQSQAKPNQLSEGWIGIVGDFSTIGTCPRTFKNACMTS
jgi:hypothetical protein